MKIGGFGSRVVFAALLLLHLVGSQDVRPINKPCHSPHPPHPADHPPQPICLHSVGPKSVTSRKQTIKICTSWSKYVFGFIAIFIVQVQTDNEEKKSKNLAEQPACLEDAKEMKVKPFCLTSQINVHFFKVVCKKTEEEMANNWVFLDCLDALPDNQSLSSKCETLV